MNKRENIYSLQGFSKVFRFTVAQTLKNKAYRASLILFVVIMSIMSPLQYIISRNTMKSTEEAMNADTSEFAAQSVIVVNDTQVVLTEAIFSDALSNTYEHIDINMSSDKDAALAGINSDTAVILIGSEANGYMISGVISDSSDIKPEEIAKITSVISDVFDEERLNQSNLNAEIITRISAGVDTGSTLTEDDFYAEENKTVGKDQYFSFILAYAVIMMLVISLTNSYIISSVTEEKTSKLVETLLVSVRPLALLFGKIAGMMAYTLSIMVFGFLGSKVSNLIMTIIFGEGAASSPGVSFNFNLFTEFGTFGFLILLINVVIAYLSFSLLSGLFGSACVKTEDIQTASGTVMLICMTGYMAAIFAGIPDSTVANHVVSLLPPVSYYCAPIMYLCGRIDLWVLLVSYLIQILILWGLALVSARTYRNLILSDSSTPKLAAIIKTARG